MKIKRILSVLVVFVMIACVFCGCGGQYPDAPNVGELSSDTTSSEDSFEDFGNQEEVKRPDTDTSQKESSYNSSSTPQSSRPSSSQAPSSSSPSSVTPPISSETPKNNISGIDKSVDPAAYKGTTVTYVTWKDPDLNEDGVAVDAFEKKYNITVEIQLISQGTYVNTIASSIASGTQGDVFFENGDFPGSLNVMQPLDAAMLDLTDPIWNQALIKASTLDGHAYLVDAISNVWTEVDICVWNKNIFESNNLTTPTEYYEAGKWTFANFREAAKLVSKLGKEYTGAGALGESALGAAGSSFFTYADNKMSVTVDTHLREVMDFLAQMRVDGYLKRDRVGFDAGKQGMTLTNCLGLKKTGYFSTINPDHVRATYLPVWMEGDPQQVTGIYRGWGLIDGAKNPVGAGLFLREYLDVNNYDLDNTFHNQDVANFFFQVTGQYSENMIYYHGPDMVKTTGMGESFHQAWLSYSDMKTYIDSKLPVMEEMCTKANEIIEAERKWIRESEQNGTLPDK